MANCSCGCRQRENSKTSLCTTQRFRAQNDDAHVPRHKRGTRTHNPTIIFFFRVSARVYSSAFVSAFAAEALQSRYMLYLIICSFFLFLFISALGKNVRVARLIAMWCLRHFMIMKYHRKTRKKKKKYPSQRRRQQQQAGAQKRFVMKRR